MRWYNFFQRMVFLDFSIYIYFPGHLIFRDTTQEHESLPALKKSLQDLSIEKDAAVVARVYIIFFIIIKHVSIDLVSYIF